MEQGLIVVKQLPVIEERLKTIKSQIESQTKAALGLECSEDTVKEIKKVRTSLGKSFKELEEQRKAVKSRILSPYEAFEKIYRECVTDVYAPADAELKKRIDDVESELKQRKRNEVEAYYLEYAASKSIDFIPFDRAGIAVTLSASMKSLKDQVTVFLDDVADDLVLISHQEHADEIMLEYRESLSASRATTTVLLRHEAIREEQERRAEAQATVSAKATVVEKVDAVLPPQEIAIEPVTDAAKQYEVAFTVRGTLAQIKHLKTFLVDGGYDYEQHVRS